jgi:small conductance mechanosensitive channel
MDTSLTTLEQIRNTGIDLAIIVGVAYDTDLDLAFATIDQVLRDNPRVLRDPPPFVQTLRLADSCVEIAIKPWVAMEDCHAALSEINKAILEAFRRHKIAIPFPQREIRLITGAAAGEVAQLRAV